MLLPLTSLLLALAAQTGATPEAPHSNAATLGFRVEAAPDWDDLFDQQSGGWTGADGIFSFPLNGDERNLGYRHTGTFFVFSDTFTANVRADNSRASLNIVHNTAAYRPAGDPWTQPVNFFTARDPQDGTPIDMFPPSLPGAAPNDWYWMKDGIILNDRAYLLASWWAIHPLFIAQRKGVVMVEIPYGDLPPFPNQIQRDTPLYVPDNGNGYNIVYGGAIMPNTQTAGAPHADGYIYIYGHSDSFAGDGFNKAVFVARVNEAGFGDFNQWRYWDGISWSTNVEDSFPITDLSSLECSVTPLADGRYLMVFQYRQTKEWVAVRIGASPIGPWSAATKIYECPEPTTIPGTFCYNAKAHPHLSQAGELLISYNVNTSNNADQKANADIYRPRFIRLIAQ